MSKWPHDDTAALKAFYGNPTGSHGVASLAWQKRNLVRVQFPWRAVLAWDTKAPIKACMFHVRCAPALEAAMQSLWNKLGHDQKKLEETGLHLFGGTFNYRVKRGLATLSVHAFGAAIDFDPLRNGLGDQTPHMPAIVVETFAEQGATWGGHFHRKDGMHFQFADT